MLTFVSLVGYQPAAVAVTLASWVEANPNTVSRVLLLTTPEVTTPRSQIVIRLQDWIRKTYSGIECECLGISKGLSPQDGLLPPAQAFQKWIKQHPDDAKEIIFNVGPGLNSHVVTLQLTMSPETILLHPMADKLHTSRIKHGQEIWASYDLVDIGLDALLGLHDLLFQIENRFHPLIDQLLRSKLLDSRIVCGLSLAGGKVQFDLAFEQRGQLHGLVVIADGDLLQKTRDLQLITSELSGLRPRIAVLSPYDKVLARARQAGFLAISSESNSGSHRFADWIQRKVPLPGWQDFRKAPGGLHLGTVQGKGGSGPPLAVYLGTDPSATLISLCTHQPQCAWICYDASTPKIEEVAVRLKFSIENLPVGQVEFIRTDFLGRGIFQELNRKMQSLPKPIRVDITPGTKAQGCALARLPGVEIWALHGDVGEARCISCPQSSPLALLAPDIVTQARASGGYSLISEGEEASRLTRQQKNFFELLTRFLAHYAEEHRCRRISLTNLGCDHGSLQPIKGRGIEVIFNSQRQSWHLKTEGGHWLEVAVAHAFQAAGADEVRYRLKWGWTSALPTRQSSKQPRHRLGHQIHARSRVPEPHMTEVDVLARFQHRFVAISCKTGNETIARAKREIESVALGMGRFCIPILVHPWVKDSIIEKSIEAQHGAAIVDLRYIADPLKLQAALNRKFKAFSSQ